MSKKKTKTTSSETVAPSTYAQPYIDKAGSAVSDAYGRSNDLLTKYLPQIDRGIDFYGGVMSGEGFNNPFMQDVIDSTNRDVTEGVNSQFATAGRYGSGMYTDVLADRLNRNSSGIRMQNYNQERAYQMAAPGQMAGLIQTAIGAPQSTASNYAGNIANLYGRYLKSDGNSTSKSSGGLLGGILGTALTAGANRLMGG